MAAAASPSWFDRTAESVTAGAGSPWAIAGAVAFTGAWLATGPVFSWSDTWQLIANTVTTIITFLMVFVIQHSQNRDTAATHVKLDELIRSLGEARNEFIGLERRSEAEIRAAGEAVKLSQPQGDPPSGASVEWRPDP